MGYEIAVSDELIAEALNALLADRRDIILLSYFLDLNDREIAQRLNLVQRTANYRRTSTLSARPLYDDYGNVHLFLDEELRWTLETKLITKILTFDVA